MRRITFLVLLGAAIASAITVLAACDDDTTVNPAPHDSGAEAASEAGHEGGSEAGAEAPADASAEAASDAAGD